MTATFASILVPLSVASAVAVLTDGALHLPEPPRYFLEFAAVGTVLLIAGLRRK